MEIHWNQSPSSPRSLLIYIDQEPWKEVDKRIFAPYLLFLKKAGSLHELEEIFLILEKKAAVQEAIRLLSSRSFFALEIKKKLEKRKFSEDAISEALKKCKSVGALDDNEQAARFIEKEKRKGKGPHLIALKLQSKQGKKSSIHSFSEEEEVLSVQKLLAGRYKKWSLSLQEKQKAYLALQRRGFSSDSILAAMKMDLL